MHLTPHHLIFSHAPPEGKPRELWITYPIIQICTLRPSPVVSHSPSSIRLRCRDFTFICFCFYDGKKAREVFDSIKAWTCQLGKIEKLYAFTYQPQTPEKGLDGWKLYDPRKEWERLGVTEQDTGKAWRMSQFNTDYAVSLTNSVGISVADHLPLAVSQALPYNVTLESMLTLIPV